MSIATQIEALQNDKTAIRNAIINKGGTSASGNGFDDFATDIATIPTGVTPTGTISITENGTHDVTNYASANVNVGSSRTQVTFPTTISTNTASEIATVFETLYQSAGVSGTYVYFVNTATRISGFQVMIASFYNGTCKMLARCYTGTTTINAIPTTSTNQTLNTYAGDVYDVYVLA